jgi:hypothetical protein
MTGPGLVGCDAKLPEIIDGAQTAHTMIGNRWLTHTGHTNWSYFDNFGRWGKAYLDRAATADYFQFPNPPDVAGYYFAFVDGRGVPLDASVAKAYTLRFTPDQIPQAERFWSLTAYLPESITLVPNQASKYVVASYTPGLQRDPDGSITIYMQPDPPTTVPTANWLPVPNGGFNVTLRVYGPTGNTTPGTYEPPAIKPTGHQF